MMKTIKKEYIMAGTTVILWSTLPSVSKLIINELSPMSATFYASLIAAVTLLVINLIRGGAGFYKVYKLHDYARIACMGFLGLFCYTSLYYLGLSRLTSQIAGIINYMWPIMIVLFSCIILRERLTGRKLAAMLISFSGMIIICAQGLFGGGESFSRIGMVCCFLAAVCYGIYSAFNKKYDYDQWIVLNVAFAVTALFSGAYCAISDDFGTLSLSMIPGLLWIGIFVNAIAYVLWGMAVNQGETARISILAYICPFLSLIFGRLLLDEHISMSALAGLVFIVGGVFVQMDLRGREKRM